MLQEFKMFGRLEDDESALVTARLPKSPPAARRNTISVISGRSPGLREIIVLVQHFFYQTTFPCYSAKITLYDTVAVWSACLDYRCGGSAGIVTTDSIEQCGAPTSRFILWMAIRGTPETATLYDLPPLTSSIWFIYRYCLYSEGIGV